MLITLNQIIDQNKINTLLDNQIVLLKLFNNDSANIDKFKQYISTKIWLAIKPYLNYESLFDLDTSTQMLEMLFNDWFIEMYKSSVFESLFFNKNFYDYDNLGIVNNENISTTNYAGYDVANQQGEFLTNTNTNKNTGQNRLQYMVLLDTASKKWMLDFTNQILFKMVKLIY